MLAGKDSRLCIVGAAGSPSCGVLTTSRGYRGGLPGAAERARLIGRSVFMEELLAELERRNMPFQVEEAGKKEG